MKLVQFFKSKLVKQAVGATNGSSLLGKEQSRPSVFLTTLPKSGTDFTVNGLLKTSQMRLPEVYLDPKIMAQLRSGYGPKDPRLTSTGNFDTQTLDAQAVKSYADDGYIIPTHMAASHHNLMAILEAGIRKVTVIMRDPRDATVSLTYHIAKAGPELRNLHSEFQFVPHDYHEWAHDEQIEFQARIFLPRAVNWIESWLWAQCDAYDELDIQYLHFDDLRHDSVEFLKKVTDFHNLTEVDFDQLQSPEDSAHFRSGQHDQWRSEFSPETIEYANWLVGDRLQRAYSDAVQWRLSRIRPATTTQNETTSLFELLSLVEMFPWVENGFIALRDAIEVGGNALDHAITAELAAYYAKDPPIMRKPRKLLEKLTSAVKTAIEQSSVT